jgi:hypothetical protein
LHSIYDLPEYEAVLPRLTLGSDGRRHRLCGRYSFRCPGFLKISNGGINHNVRFPIEVIEVSRYGFQARSSAELPLNVWSDATVRLGKNDTASIKAMAVRDHVNGAADVYGFSLGDPDVVWSKFIGALSGGMTYGDLDAPSRMIA